MYQFEILLFKGDFSGRVAEVAAQYGFATTGRSWPEGEAPADVDPNGFEWLVTWAARGWTVVASPGGVAALDDPDEALELSKRFSARVALAVYQSTTELQLFDLFDAGVLIRSFKFYGDGEPAEEEGEPLCEAAAEGDEDEDELDFAEGTIFNALTAMLGFECEELLEGKPRRCVEYRAKT